MSNGNQPWVLIVVALVGVLIAGVAFKQCSSSSPQEDLRAQADRAVVVAARSDRGGWSAQGGGGQEGGSGQEGDSMAAGGVGRGAESVDAGGEGATSGGSAETVRQELRRRSQQAAAAAAGGPSLRAAANAPKVAAGSGRDDPFKGARERGAGQVASAPLAVPAVVPDALRDPNASAPSETPALSVLAKDGQARDDSTLVAANSATYQAGEGHVFDTESEVKIPNAGNISGDAGSIAFELKPKWEGGDNSDASFFDLRTPNEWNNRMELVKNGQYLRFLMWDSQGTENGIGFQMKNWAPDESHPIAVTWGVDETGQRVMSLYVDGAKVGQQIYQNDFNVPTNQPLVIGNNAGGALGARAGLNGFQVFNNPLDSAHIASLFGAK